MQYLCLSDFFHLAWCPPCDCKWQAALLVRVVVHVVHVPCRQWFLSSGTVGAFIPPWLDLPLPLQHCSWWGTCYLPRSPVPWPRFRIASLSKLGIQWPPWSCGLLVWWVRHSRIQVHPSPVTLGDSMDSVILGLLMNDVRIVNLSHTRIVRVRKSAHEALDTSDSQ